MNSQQQHPPRSRRNTDRCGQAARGHHNRPAASAGMTLIELMIAVVIMGILLAVAFPSYLDSVRKGRRAEGIAALTALQHAQERFRANSAVYGNLNAVANAETLPNRGALARSSNERYALAVTDNTAIGYTAIATAAGAQADDTACKMMGVRAAGGNLRYGSGTGSIDFEAAEPDAGRCWAK